MVLWYTWTYRKSLNAGPQQEPRILAHMSGDQNFQDAYAHGKDIYAWCGSIVYNIPYEECLEFRPDGSVNPEGKQRRSNMKSVILGQHIRPLYLVTSIRKRCEPYYSRVCE